MIFDGAEGSYVGLDAWEWGGVASFEVFLLADDASNWARVFELGSGDGGKDSVVLGVSGLSGDSLTGFFNCKLNLICLLPSILKPDFRDDFYCDLF